MITRNKFINVYRMHPIILRLDMIWHDLLTLFNPDRRKSEKIMRKVWGKQKRFNFTKVLNKGEIVAVQAGVAVNPEKRKRYWYDNYSDLWGMARLMGNKGTLIAIEPNLNSATKIQDIISVSEFKCKFIVKEAALYKEKSDSARIQVGGHLGENRLHQIRNSQEWKNQQPLSDDLPKVETETLDNILAENEIDLKSVAYVNLTINGAEYDALQGMTKLLEESEDISITLAAGREQEGENDIGFIDGESDHVVISRFMAKYGFKVELHRFWEGAFGYLVCTKGKQRVFM